MITIHLIDNRCERYTQQPDCTCLGRRWDNVAEKVQVVKPKGEENNVCAMIMLHDNEVIDHIIVGEEPIDITSNASQYPSIKIGFSFSNETGYVKNSEVVDYYFADAIKPTDFVPMPPTQEENINNLIGKSFVRSEIVDKTLNFYNIVGDIVSSVDLSEFGGGSAEVTTDKILNVIEDSESIVVGTNEDGTKVHLSLDAEISSRINKSLVTPMSRPTSTELVAIDNTNAQTLLGVGDGLVVENGVIKSTCTGGSGGASVGVIDNLISQSTTDALSARQGNVLYNMLVDAGKQINQSELDAQKQLLIGGDGVFESNVYNFTIDNANAYLDYRTNLTKFLVDLNLPLVGALDTTKEVTITFGDTSYYVFNILKGMEHATIGDLHQVDKYNNETGYRFIAEMTFFQTSDVVGFAIIPTISMSDILSLNSDQMDNYMADGGLTQGQLAVCNKVITNGYDEGALYRFDIMYPNTYSWTKLSYSKTEIDALIGDIETLLSEV